MDITQLQRDVERFVSEHPTRRFSKTAIAYGVAQQRISENKAIGSEGEMADAIFCVINQHHIRTWPGIQLYTR